MQLSRYRALKTLKWTALLLAFPCVAIGLGSPPRDAAAGTQPPADYRLVWSDEFEALHLGDRANAWLPYWWSWNVRHLAGNNDQAAKYADDEMLEGGLTAGAMLGREGRWGAGPYLHEVSTGTLKLRAYPLGSAGRARTSGFPFIAAMISGERQPAQHFGYWETRLRINRLGDGLHLAVWLLSDAHQWPPEIDMLEVVGLDPARFHANSHRKAGNAPEMSSYTAPNGATGWHVFGFEWTAERMRWIVDGKVVREHGNLFGDDRLYFLVSWEVGGNWAGMPTGNTPWPGEVEIDYVRLYQKAPHGQEAPGQAGVTGPGPAGASEPVAATPPATEQPQPTASATTDRVPQLATPATPPQPASMPPAEPAAAVDTSLPPAARPALPQPSIAWRQARLRELSGGAPASPGTTSTEPPAGPEAAPPPAARPIFGQRRGADRPTLGDRALLPGTVD